MYDIFTKYSKEIFLLLICVSFGFSFYYVFDKKIDLNGDNAKYYLLAESISQGKGYVSVYSPREPPTSVYPPGYPALMSIVMVFNSSVIAQKLLNGFFLILSGIILFFISNILTDNELFSFFVSLFTVINFHLLKFSTMMMSESSFVFISLLSFYFFLESENKKPWRDGYFFLFLVLLSYAFHIRTQGIGLVGGFLFYYLFKKQWSHLALTATGFVLLALPWRIRNQVQGLGSSRYFDQLVQVNPWRPEKGEVSIYGLIERFVDQGSMIITKAIPDSIFNFVTVSYQSGISAQDWLLGLFVFSVMIYGFWFIDEYGLFFIGYFIATFVIVSTWSATVDNRYIITIIPFMVFGFLYGLYLITNEIIERGNISFTPALVWGGILAVVGMMMLPRLGYLNAQASRSYPKAYYNYFQSANELGQKTGCGDTLVSCRKPALFYLFSGCHSTKYKTSKDTEKVLKEMIEKGVDYVVLEQLGFSSTARYLYPAIKSNRSLFAPVIRKKKPNTYILKFYRDRAVEKIN